LGACGGLPRWRGMTLLYLMLRRRVLLLGLLRLLRRLILLRRLVLLGRFRRLWGLRRLRAARAGVRGAGIAAGTADGDLLTGGETVGVDAARRLPLGRTGEVVPAALLGYGAAHGAQLVHRAALRRRASTGAGEQGFEPAGGGGRRFDLSAAGPGSDRVLRDVGRRRGPAVGEG